MSDILVTYGLIINLVGFLSMIIDKRKAINHKWRISESTLFLIAIIGGTAGTIIGMYSVRHKTKHLKFTIGLPVILIFQILFIYYILIL